MKDYQKRAADAQVERYKKQGIVKVTLRISEEEKEKFLKLAAKSRQNARARMF